MVHYYAIVDIKDNLLGKDGEMKLYKDRNIAKKQLGELKKKKGHDKFFLASYKVQHQMSYGKVFPDTPQSQYSEVTHG